VGREFRPARCTGGMPRRPRAWFFDDGGSASGDSVEHAFATPGPHSATAVGTDPPGVAGTATATVTIVDSSAPLLVIGRARSGSARRAWLPVPLTCPATEL
jgi:hypothetical protein